MLSVNQPLSRAQAAAVDPANMHTWVVSGVTQKGQLTTIAEMSSAMAAWTSATQGAYELNATINRESTSETPWKRSVHTSVQRKCASFSHHTEIDYSRLITDTKFNLNVRAVGARVFPIFRGAWYDSTWLRASNVEFPEGSRFTMADFFGEKGSLHMVPTQMLVIYKPKVEITISTTMYEQTVKNW